MMRLTHKPGSQGTPSAPPEGALRATPYVRQRARVTLLGAIMVLLGTAPVVAQHHPGHSEHADKVDRPIKALSPERVQELLDGAGAGYALAAELNGYPGPRHVLELRGPLSLEEAQEAAVAEIFDAMDERARELGRALVEAEGRVEAAFRRGDVTHAELERLTRDAMEVEARLRRVHLGAHIRTRGVLTESQIARYHELRGYAEP